MPVLRAFLPMLLLAGCHPAPLVEACPNPIGTSSGLTLANQLLLRRGSDLGPGAPDFTLSLTSSGDALYSGGPAVPVPGRFMGRLGADRFQALLAQLLAAGLTLTASEPDTGSIAPQCGAASVISLSVQTADGRYLRQAFCAQSATERQLAGPIYRAAEGIRWQPGSHMLSLQTGS